MDKKALTGLNIGGIALASAIVWTYIQQRIGLSFEMLEP